MLNQSNSKYINVKRYEKQLMLKEFGETNQLRCKNTKVLIIGIGGIGCQVLTQLALVGFENIGICDHDTVSFSNLNRQFIYTVDDLGRAKIDCAERFIISRNPITIIKYNLKITNKNARKIFEPYDIIIDCTDNVFARYIINDACFLMKKVYVFASAIQTSFQSTVFDFTKDTTKPPCLRCIFPRLDNLTCESQGVLGTIPNMVGIIAANEVIKYAIGEIDNCSIGKLQMYSLYSGFYEININKKNEKCLICGESPTITDENYDILEIYEEKCDLNANRFGIARENIKALYPDFAFENIIVLNDDVALEEYERYYVNLLKSSDPSNPSDPSIPLIFNCGNKIRSKILVNSLMTKEFGIKILYLI